MNELLSEKSNRSKKFLKFAPPSDMWDEIVEDFCEIDAVVNCESAKRYNPHWEKEYHLYDFLVYIRKEDFTDQEMVNDYSKRYMCNIAVIGFREEKTEDGIFEIEEILLKYIGR